MRVKAFMYIQYNAIGIILGRLSRACLPDLVSVLIMIVLCDYILESCTLVRRF